VDIGNAFVGGKLTHLPVIPQLYSNLRLETIGGHLAGLPVLHQLISDLLAIVQTAQSHAFNGGNVHKQIGAAVIWLDEAEALRSFSYHPR
jgi:hypothetical protein